MNEKQYQLLCDTCDLILQEPNISIERAAIAWLHVLSEHPVTLTKYTDKLSEKSPVLIRIKSLMYTIRQLGKLESSNQKWVSSCDINGDVDVVFISHLLNESQIYVKSDFYFGGLPEKLMQEGISSLVALHNHTGFKYEHLLSKVQSNIAPRILFPSLLSLGEEYKLRSRLKKEAEKLNKQSKLVVNKYHKSIIETAAKQALSITTIINLRLYHQFKNMIGRVNAKTLIVLYEGHAWERLAFAAARSVNPDIRCIGYQHAILFQRQHAIKRGLGNQMDPDIVVTVGDITRDFLKKNNSLGDVKISTVGASRLSNTDMDLSIKLANTNNHSCLIIPDGNVCECLTIVNFSIDAAILLPEISFIIRMHPIIKFNDVMKLDKRLEKLPVNIEISDVKIAKDFDRCRWAIYRGSGAAIHAVTEGLRPFYLSLPNELAIDPLHNLFSWKTVVSRPDELVKHIKNDLKSNADSLMLEFNAAKDYCKKYFLPFDESKFQNEICGHYTP